MTASVPHLLFIMTDHQRADSLGMTQDGVEVAPNLNRLAERGAVFRRAYNACPLCVPARTALATGKYPTRNGVMTNDWHGTTAGDHVPLHELLYRQGYDVAHIGVHHIRVNPVLEKRLPFRQWEDGGAYAAHLRARGSGGSSADAGTFKRTVQENQAGRPVACPYSNTQTAVWPGNAEDFKDLFWCGRAVEFIRERRDKPFALFLCLWAPHPPLCVPEPFASRFRPDRIDLPANVGRPSPGEPAAYRAGVPAQLAEGVTPEEWRRVWAAHLGLVHLADTGIGRVLDSLREVGLQDRTLVVFTSDHGDHLGQHGMYQKMEMYEQAIRVPLVVSGPGIAVQSVETPVSHLDLLPTLCDMLGARPPDGIDGVSLAATLRDRATAPRRTIFSQYSGNPVPGDVRRCAISGSHKYVWSPPDGFELYDLDADPLEMTNLAALPEHRVTVARLHRECRAWGQAHADPAFAGEV